MCKGRGLPTGERSRYPFPEEEARPRLKTHHNINIKSKVTVGHDYLPEIIINEL